ncbi:MAG: retention module-containing protein [Zoogloea sp.]|nr:retention module-containing protein [Zoogloea sp.]
MATSASPVSTAPQATVKGTVVFVQGDAYLRDSSGKLTAIKPGDVVAEGDAIVTAAGAIVELQLPSGAKLSVGPERELLLNDELFATAAPERSENIVSSLGADADKVIQALNGGTDPFDGLEEPAAGVTGGGLGDQTHDFVRLVRILEEVTPVSYTYSSSTDGIDFLPAAGTTTLLVPANTPPVANPDATAATEDSPVSIDVLGNDTDADGDPLSVTGASVDPAKGSVTVNADGTLTFTPAANVNGPVEITYTISDGKGGTASATTTVDIAPVADAARVGTGSGTVTEDTPAQNTASGTVSIVDPDAGEAAFQPQTNSAGTYGSFTLAADGAWTYTLDNTKPEVQALKEGQRSTETFTVTSIDGTTSTVTITVIGTNDAPVAVADNASTDEDQPVTLNPLANDTDPDADTLAVTNASAANGQVTINTDGTLRYVPNPDFNGTDTVTYTISDGNGGTSTATVTINVTPVPDAPVAVADLAATDEDQPVTFTVLDNDTDADGDTLSVTGASVDPAKGSVVVNPDGTLTFTPAANVNGPVEITYTISDGKGGTSSAIATVNIAPVNDPASISKGAGTVQEETTLLASGTLTVTDPDADQSAFQAQSGTPGTYGSFSIDAAGHWTYTLDNGNPLVQGLATGDTRSETFTVASLDGTESTVVVTVLGLNEVIGAPGVGIVKEDNPIQTGGQLTASGGANFVAQPSTPGNYGSLTLNPDGSWTYTLANPTDAVQSLRDGEIRTETFPVSLSDGTTSTITITVVGTNDPALVSRDSGMVTEDSALTTNGVLTVSDADAGESAFRPQAAVAGQYGSLTLDAAGNWTYTLDNTHPAVQALGLGDTLSETFPVATVDGTPSRVAITINGTNDAPVVTPDSKVTPEDQPISGALTATDPDGDPLSFALKDAPSNGTVTVKPDGTYTYTPNRDYNGPDSFTVTVSDGKGGSVVTTVSLTVTPLNDDPVARNDANGLVKTDTVPATGNLITNPAGADTDVDGDTLAVSNVAGVAVTGATVVTGLYGTLTIQANGQYSYIQDATNNTVTSLAPGATLQDAFTYTVTDGQGGSANAVLSITIAGANTPPVARADVVGTPEDSAVTFAVLDNDTDPENDTLSVTGATVDPLKGTVVVNANGTLTFTPAPDVNGPVEVTYTISDGKGGTSTAIATINVTPTADTAVLGSGSGTVKEDTPAQTTASGTLSIVDPDAGEAAFQPLTNVPGLFGTLSLAADGAWTYTLDNTKPEVQALKEGETRPETFTVSSVDGTTTTVSITVTGTNDGPTAVADLAATNEDQPVTFAVLGNDTDPDGDTLSVTGATVDPLKGTVVVNANGSLTFTPAANVNGPVEVTYTITDGKGGTSTAIATINVTPTADTAVLGSGTGTVKEDTPAQTTASGTLSIVDPDAGEAAFQP